MLCGAVSFHSVCVIQGHQHKRFDSLACFNEISSLIGKILMFQSLMCSSRNKARAFACFVSTLHASIVDTGQVGGVRSVKIDAT